MKYEIKFKNLEEFYTECDIFDTDHGNKYMYNEHSNEDNPDWIGLGLEKIKESKYNYKEGLDKLKELDLELNLGGKRKQYVWAEDDGDEMSMERFHESLPFMSKRKATDGDKNGKFVNLYVNICECAYVSYDSMLNKTYTAIQLTDYLENSGYKVGIILEADVKNLGKFGNDSVEHLHIEVPIKQPDEPLLKPLLLTCISPWMFRHHIFKLWTAKFDTNGGLGSPYRVPNIDTKNNLYIGIGDCLNKESVEKKLEHFKSLFGDEAKDEE